MRARVWSVANAGFGSEQSLEENQILCRTIRWKASCGLELGAP